MNGAIVFNQSIYILVILQDDYEIIIITQVQGKAK